MALQSSGPISLNDINIELGRESGSTIQLSLAEIGSYVEVNQASINKPDGNPPHSISEWYGYEHITCPAYGTPTGNTQCIANNEWREYHDGNCGTYWENTFLFCNN